MCDCYKEGKINAIRLLRVCETFVILALNVLGYDWEYINEIITHNIK